MGYGFDGLLSMGDCRVDPNFQGSQCRLASPHSNAVVDLNGDCLAGTLPSLMFAYPLTFLPTDIFLLCDNGSGNKYYQIWVNNKDKGFSLARTGSFPAGLQAVSFADIGQSAPFIIFPPSF